MSSIHTDKCPNMPLGPRRRPSMFSKCLSPNLDQMPPIALPIHLPPDGDYSDLGLLCRCGYTTV